MPIVLEIKFYKVWAINPVWADPSLSGRFRITLIQYRDTLVVSERWASLCLHYDGRADVLSVCKKTDGAQSKLHANGEAE